MDDVQFQLKVTHVKITVSKYGKSFVLEVCYISAQSQRVTISNTLPFLVEAFSNLPVYNYFTFIACVTSCLVICLHRESFYTDVSSVHRSQVVNQKLFTPISLDN